jgi:hypothetical protein
MSKARNITAEFRQRSLRDYGVLMLSAPDACAMIRRAEREGVKILGIDSFTLPGDSIQPSAEHGVDFSSRGYYSDEDWSIAVRFIETRASLGLVFEVVLGDPIAVGKLPNQSTDPTFSSGTPGAGHQARHP